MCFITADRHALSHAGQSDVTWCPSSPLSSVFLPADGAVAGSRLGRLRTPRPAAPLIPALRVVTRRCHRGVICADSPMSQEAAPWDLQEPPTHSSRCRRRVFRCLLLCHDPPPSRLPTPDWIHTPELRFELKTHQICSCSDDRQKLTNNVSSLCSRTRD